MMGNKKLERSEDLLKSAFDHASEEEFAKICAVTSGMDLPMKHSEQMAWSVIDKAELYDEAEKKRRAEFKAKVRKRRIRNTCVGVGIVAVILVVLYRFGVFDAFLLNKYSYAVAYETAQTYYTSASSEGTDAAFCPVGESVTDPYHGHPGDLFLLAGTTLEVLDQNQLPEDFPDIDKEKLSHTIYDALSRYCSENEVAVDDYVIKGQLACKVPGDREKNEYALVVYYVGTFLDYKASDVGKTWVPLPKDKTGIKSLPQNMGYISSELRIDL